jgi:tetratricopeptide (TPR) repeat protein
MCIDSKASTARRRRSSTALGASHPDVGQTLTNLANVFRDQGKYGETEELYKRALSIIENAKGANHRDVAWTLTNLALLYWRQGRYGDAEALHKRALTIREQVLGESHPRVADVLNSLALVYWTQGKYSEANGASAVEPGDQSFCLAPQCGGAVLSQRIRLLW